LVSAEVALSTVLLIGAGLLLASFQRVMHAPRGFESNNIIAVDLVVPEAKYRSFEQKVAFFESILNEVATLPSVRLASYANGVPLVFPWHSELMPVLLPGRQNLPFYESPIANWWHISSGYFAAMGIPMLAGRTFEEKEKEPVAVVSETAARRLWPGENPIGKRFRHSFDPKSWFQVIGVVKDVREFTLDYPFLPMVYLPYWHPGLRSHPEAQTLVARTALGPAAIAAAIRDRVRKVDRDVAVPEVRTMTHLLSNSLAQRRFQAGLLAAFAGLALLLASIGIYGVVSYTAAQRRPEIGIRVTLGADPRNVLSLMLLQGIRPVAIGVVVGLIAAAGLTRFLASLLFEVKPLDPLTFAAVPVLLSLIAVLACYLPARQAALIDPMTILRQE
jgi:putative ABC transport system permease protein